jgi:hypothetical protein
MNMLRKPKLAVGLLLSMFAGCAGCQGNPSVETGDNFDNRGPAKISDTYRSDAGADIDVTFASQVPPGSFKLDGSDGTQAGSGVTVNPATGALVLSANEVSFQFAWIANNQMGTVSKFDTKTGKEIGRYYAVIPRDGTGKTNGLRGDVNNQPSRTAVDLFGDVWVANRAPDTGAFGSVTKIANDEATCESGRDGNLELRTSRDVNNDGKISTNPADGEMIVPTDFTDPKQYDECVLFSTSLGSNGAGVKARAMAISMGTQSAGDIWVGHWADKKVFKLDAKDGSVKQAIPIAFGPYGAAIDGDQRLWVVKAPGDSTESTLALIDATTGTLVSDTIAPSTQTQPGKLAESTNAYGIGIDGKKRVWIAGWTSGPKAIRYAQEGLNVASGSWVTKSFLNEVSQTGSKLGRARGIAVDDQGIVWMSSDRNAAATGAAQLIAFNGDTFEVKKFNVAGKGLVDFIDATNAKYPNGTVSDTHTSIGVGLDAAGHPWVNNYSGTAMRVHRDTGELLITADQPGQLYTYSDFTGYQLRKFTAPRGEFRKDFVGCGDDTRWQALTWEADLPAGTSLEAWIKVAPTAGDLNNTNLTRYGPFTQSPTDLVAAGVPRAAYLRVEFILKTSARTQSPSLKTFDVKYNCSTKIE